jgi:hypothetical protein
MIRELDGIWKEAVVLRSLEGLNKTKIAYVWAEIKN